MDVVDITTTTIIIHNIVLIPHGPQSLGPPFRYKHPPSPRPRHFFHTLTHLLLLTGELKRVLRTSPCAFLARACLFQNHSGSGLIHITITITTTIVTNILPYRTDLKA